MSRENGIGSLFSRTTLAHAVSGAVGSVVAMALTYPLDRVRTIKQLSRGKTDNRNVVEVIQHILRTEGTAGLYRGLQPMLVALGFSNFVYFYWFTALRAALQYVLRRRRPKGSPVTDVGAAANLLMASIAGTLNVLITTPLWVAYTRLAVQALPSKQPTSNGDAGAAGGSPESPQEKGAPEPEGERYTGVLDALGKIARRDGVSALWSGMGPSLILVSNPSVQFASYEWLKRAILRIKLQAEPGVKDYAHMGDIMDDTTDNVESEAVLGPELSSVEYLLLGATAKMIATVVTYPLQVAQTRLRAETSKTDDGSDSGAPRRPHTTLSCLREVYSAEGVAGLYRGMEAKLLQTCLTSAFMFAAYERICAIILRFILWRKFSLKHKASS